jgi:DNA repair protein SbcC/Rad50
VRPLRLSVKGLRSYRAECTVDFSGRSLVAIVGDTGAGKSSLLEAIVYALFNATTWSGGEPKLLISDGAQTLSVELDFEVSGQHWRIHRSTSRTPYPKPVHKLSCLTDPALGELDGDEAVSRQVEKLLGGMRREAFLAAVILPQGRFQTLLLSEGGERTRILEGIFRLNELRTVKERAEALKAWVEPVVRELRGRRMELLPDPRSEVQAREAELEKASTREAELRAFRLELTRVGEAESTARAEAVRLREPAQRARRVERGAAATLKGLVTVATALQSQIDQLEKELAQLTQSETELALRRTQAAERQETYEDLAAAQVTLRRVRQDLDQMELERQAVVEEERAIEAEAQRLAGLQQGLTDLERTATAAEGIEEQAGRAVEEQRQRRLEIAGLIGAAREAARLAALRKAEEARLAQQPPGLKAAVDSAERQAEEASAERRLAAEALSDLQRLHSAAAAAEGLHPGDLCPVCGEPLPEAWQPPTAAELGPARRRVEDAQQAEKSASERAIRARADLEAGALHLSELSAKRLEAEDAAAAALGALHRLHPGADLSRSDTVLLEPADQSMAKLAAEHREAAARARTARSEFDRATAAAEPTRQALDLRRAAAERSQARLQEGLARCRNELKALPIHAQAREPTPAALEEALGVVASRLALAREEKARWEQLVNDLKQGRDRFESATRQYEQEVARPRRRMLALVVELLPPVNECLAILGQQARERATEDTPLTDLVAYAGDLEECGERVAEELEGRATAIELAAAQDAAAVRRELDKAGFADARALEEETSRLIRQVGQLEAAARMAGDQVALAEELDRRLALGDDLLASAGEVSRLLGNAQFISYVIERRQKNLLAVASEILRTMTANRYGFAETFEIVDGQSGQPRPTRTLSGGETFLASLALALALVEIANRSGSHLGALFLDEGFGALDANALDEALAALERAPGDRRLVAVVSHVKAVAERIEDVLEVVRTPLGSRADWRGASERDALVSEELEAGLLA